MKPNKCHPERSEGSLRFFGREMLQGFSRNPRKVVKNIQIIDGADNATYSIFEATDDEFAQIFPQPGQDLEVVEDYVIRVGEDSAQKTLAKLWERPVYKQHVQGIHGTLFYDYKEKAKHLPQSKREIDRTSGSINAFEREVYDKFREGK